MENERKIKEDIREALETCLPDIADYGKIKGRLSIRLLGKEECEKIKGAVYELLGDVAILLCIRVLDDMGTTVNCVVDAGIFQMWGVPKEQAFREALEAASIYAPPRLYPPEDFQLPKGGNGHAFLSGEYVPDRDIGGNCLSTEQFANGAAAVFYPGVAEKLAELLGGGFFLLFLDP